jgi:hypothetical protein
MFDRKDKHFRLGRSLVAEFKRSASLLGFSETQAAEIALAEWVKKNHDEVQKKLDLYAEKGGITINEPEHVEIKVFQRVDIFLAKEELTKRINNLDRGAPEYRKELQLELAESIHKLRPVCIQTRDPELLQLIRTAEKKLDKL